MSNHTTSHFDLLTTVEYGGCSAKLDPKELETLLTDLPIKIDKNILVDISTHDDAGVYQINDEQAIIFTTDFFPPVCSNPYTFGQIAAANALSDVYAMGGNPILALNLVMFPSKQIPLEVLKDILLGGQSKANESSTLIMGGHTIDDYPPKYGLAVVGLIHPKKLITNSGAKAGQALVLTKRLGTGIAIAAHRLNMIEDSTYQKVLTSMAKLNKQAAEMMIGYGVQGATDITGFGLLGHAWEMAKASNVSIKLFASQIPTFEGVIELLEDGCIPGAAFRNLRYIGDRLSANASISTEQKLLMADAQTSGGLLIAVDNVKVSKLVEDLKNLGEEAWIVGEVIPQEYDSDIFIC